ncbi:hypothetical protein [Pseudomonas peli]|nr:hypothetical protein [Pseudomonas peli]
MPRNETILNVFVASPSDVNDERKALDSIVQELNKTWSKNLNLRLDLLKWETDIHPSFGDYSQNVINEQIDDDYDIFIAIFWSRIGTKTPKAESGTLEEFERAYARYKSDKPTEIMIYFKDQAIPPSRMDPLQLQNIHNLKTSLGEKGGLYWTFETTEEFTSLLRVHLSKVAQKWSRDFKNPGSIKTSNKIEPIEESTEEEYGLLDYQEIFEHQMANVISSFEAISQATEIVAAQLTKRTEEINEITKANKSADPKTARKIIKLSSEDMDRYSEILELQIFIASKARAEAFDALSKSISIHITDLNSDDPSPLAEAISSMQNAAIGSKHNLTKFKLAVENLPRMTIDLNKSKRRVSLSLNKILEEIDTTLQSSDEILKTLKTI